MPDFLSGTQFGEFGLEREIGRVVRLVGSERLAHVAGAEHGGENVRRVRRFEIIQDVAAHARPMDPAHLRVMGVPDDRRGQPDLGFREAGCVAERRKVRSRIVGGVEAVGIDVLEIGDRRLGAGIRLAVGDPQRRIAPPGIECVDGGPILLDADDAVEFAAREIVQLFGDGGVRTACCRGRGGRLRRRGSIRAGRVGRIGCRRRRRGRLRQSNV